MGISASLLIPFLSPWWGCLHLCSCHFFPLVGDVCIFAHAISFPLVGMSFSMLEQWTLFIFIFLYIVQTVFIYVCIWRSHSSAECECQSVRPLLSGMRSDLMAWVHWSVCLMFSDIGLLLLLVPWSAGSLPHMIWQAHSKFPLQIPHRKEGTLLLYT